MRWLTCALLLSAWLVAMTSHHPHGRWLHALLVIACVALVDALVERDNRDSI